MSYDDYTPKRTQRREKRRIRRAAGGQWELYVAFMRGQLDASYAGKPYRNPYPPGRRYDEYRRGYGN